MNRSARIRAVVSVSDKGNLEVLAPALVAAGVEVLSTGGTARALKQLGVAVVPVSDYTGSPEILGGRVKTLHPKIHGGILATASQEHRDELARHEIGAIDLVVVNLYPFSQTIRAPGCSVADAVEQIDIGGPTLLRAAAKNFQRVMVVVDPADYNALAAILRADKTSSVAQRREWAQKAFAHTAAYDAAIAEYFSALDEAGNAGATDQLPGFLLVGGPRRGELRYGENPHQPAAFFVDAQGGAPRDFATAVSLQGKPLSYNNILDADGALGLVRDLAPLGVAAVVIKHATPCGAAVKPAGTALVEVYQQALGADRESAFGGIVALSQPCDGVTARALAATFLEVVIAPSFSPEAREVLAQKSNLRLLEMGVAPPERPSLRARSVAGGLLVQREDRAQAKLSDARHVAGPAPDAALVEDLEFAWRVVGHVRSNAVVLAQAGATVAMGGGQTSRVEAVRQALLRAGDRAKGAVLASDAFFPFRDSIDTLAAAGIRAIVQPGGSVRDEEVIAAAQEHGLTMLLTGERHFRH